MSPIPNVSFTIGESALGQVPASIDGIAGLILGGVDVTDGIQLGTPTAIYSIADAEALGIDEAYDTDNNTDAYKEIVDFYTQAGEGSELWIMVVAPDTAYADICDKNNDVAKKLLQDSNGRIRIWGANVTRGGDYTPTVTDGIDDDVVSAIEKAQELSHDMAMNAFIPTRCILPGCYYDGTPADLKDLKTMDGNRVQVTLHGRAGSSEGRVGLLLGKYAASSVQTNPGKVRDGDLGIDDAYLTDGVTRAEDIVATQDTIHDKGYIFPIKRFGRSGYFYNDDPTATTATDDFNSFARGRVIDKVQRLAYDVYLDFVNDDYDVDDNGNISAGELKRLQGSIDDRVNTQMVGEISGFESNVDPTQDVLSTGQTQVSLRTQPRAYHKDIVVEVGFTQTIS